MIAASDLEAFTVRDSWPVFKGHMILTPDSNPLLLAGFTIDDYVWTPGALALPARVRLMLRGIMAGCLDENSIEETFPETLLSW